MNKYLIGCLALIISVLCINNANAQEHVFEVRGRLVNMEGKGVQFAHIINLKKSTGSISDTAGYFRILGVSPVATWADLCTKLCGYSPLSCLSAS